VFPERDDGARGLAIGFQAVEHALHELEVDDLVAVEHGHRLVSGRSFQFTDCPFDAPLRRAPIRHHKCL